MILDFPACIPRKRIGLEEAWTMRIGPGPVFEAECLMASRRARFYGARVVLVLGLLAGLVVVWSRRGEDPRGFSTRGQADIGESFYVALMGVELAMALLVAPASASGSICEDRAGGGLLLLMTTDLSDAEIVLGRLASRLLSTLGVVACGLPALAIAALLGGVDPLAVAGGTLVVAGVAALGVSVALTFSLWAGKPHEALVATYLVGATWNLLHVAWWTMIGWPPGWVQWSNPFSLIFTPFLTPAARLPFQARFLASCLAASAALAALATWRLRAATLGRRGGGRPGARSTRFAPPSWLRWIGQAAPRLDDDPILWREWHRGRPSGFSRAIWWAYVVLSVVFGLVALFGRSYAPAVNALHVSVGLLMAGVGAATCLAEERAQGSLDVVLATPIDSRRIVLGKWLGAFRVVPRLAILPGLLTLATAWKTNSHHLYEVEVEVLPITGLVVGLVLAYGAATVGLGLWVAIHQPRPGRAAALTVAAYLAATIGLPLVVMASGGFRARDSLPTWPSPFFGIFFATSEARRDYPATGDSDVFLAFGFLSLLALFALALLKMSLGGFDEGVGRVSDRPGLLAARLSWRSGRPRGASRSGRRAPSSPVRDTGPPP